MIRLWDHCPQPWRPLLKDLLNGRVGQGLDRFLTAELADGQTIYPAIESVFACLESLSVADVRVVILGQDPYHQPGQATGRAFHVPEGTRSPPSLANILKLLEADFGGRPKSKDLLMHWEEEGVLLLNTVLTVSEGRPESHRNVGWEFITDCIIKAIVESDTRTVFLLWGSHAQKKASLVVGDQNFTLRAPHPSPLSAYRGFFDCRHFSLANDWLVAQGQPPIDWLQN